MQRLKNYLPLLLVLLLGAFLRFYKLDWGQGFFFHPDEYHIAAGVDRLSFPGQMNPKLFSYGSFTVYLIYFSQTIITSIISHFPPFASHFASAILIGRFYSALFSTLTILLIYLISKKIFPSLLHPPCGEAGCYIATLLTALLPGAIQQAHFATPESSLTFFLFLTLFLSLQYIEQKKIRYLFLGAISLGIALGIKIVALTFLPVLLLPPVFSLQFNKLNSPVQYIKSLFRLIKVEIFLLLVTGFSFFLAFPYAVLDFGSFRGSLNYEGGVADGKLLVFYTRQFIDTIPVIFQFQKILPFALGPGVLILGTLGILGALISLGNSLRKKTPPITNYYLLITLLAFISYFLLNAFLFAKWTRFVAPAFPFFALFAAYIFKFVRLRLLRVACYVLLAINLVWTAMFFSIYLRPDVRLTATDWINENLPANSQILLEGGNMLDIPLKDNALKRVSLDFYNFEEDRQTQEEILAAFSQSDYFFVQSRRVFANHLRLKEKYPKTAGIYEKLFSGELGFEKIKEFSSFPQLSIIPASLTDGHYPLSIPDEVGEETWSVFDHPVIRIYQKVRRLTVQDYENLLQI